MTSRGLSSNYPHTSRIMQVDFGAGPESEHNLHLSSHAHYEHSANNGSPAFSPFRHPAVPAIDPGLDQSSGTNRNGHAPMSSAHQSAQTHLLQPDHASLNSSHLSHPFYSDMSRNSQTPSTPSNASPRFSAISPTSQPKQLTAAFVPTDRPAPSRDVSDDTIDDAYAAFILYCNPSFPTSTDTSELTKLFRTPPKSDGKAFSTWTLFELIRKFDSKEIKTWTQLALDLGVEPPDTDKGQSTQKVQQYSVRLKVRIWLYFLSTLTSSSIYDFCQARAWVHEFQKASTCGPASCVDPLPYSVVPSPYHTLGSTFSTETMHCPT